MTQKPILPRIHLQQYRVRRKDKKKYIKKSANIGISKIFKCKQNATYQFIYFLLFQFYLIIIRLYYHFYNIHTNYARTQFQCVYFVESSWRVSTWIQFLIDYIHDHDLATTLISPFRKKKILLQLNRNQMKNKVVNSIDESIN